ncbi:histidine phosphatase superfamily [Boletus coccyginus]|nr:histidine phosphatase superfamily [Boletus coccyginus]
MARDSPSQRNSKRIKKPLQKLLSAGIYSEEEYHFLRAFKWDLGLDDLLPIGAREAFDSGSENYLRYKHLVEGNQLPFVRASESERIVYSAMNWTQGFSVASGHVYSPSVSVLISEEKGRELSEAIPGAKLDSKDVTELMPLCAFETLFHETPSPFCGLFTIQEWLAREYHEDLHKYYKNGHGNSLGPVQGVGYVNELLARLTGQPVRDKTQTNQTLDASPVTFPLDRNFYADFSHGSCMVAIYSAIGLFRPDEPPVTDRLDLARKWRISRMTPFSGRMITEKLRCSDGAEYIRILVNDAVQPLEFCDANEDGLCTLSAFVKSQAYAQNNGDGDWERCFS